jgi:hypothetical protein
VVGREAELATIREFVAGIAAGPRSLLLEGAVGIGKTTLWRAGLRADGSVRATFFPAGETGIDDRIQPREAAVGALTASDLEVSVKPQEDSGCGF